ncbi:hypothetical protein FA13DRAFT_757481 [Coprinellus micaceus]|uniref:Uncharacterized protein n=1 Tax=Coprinellus micaceus TaxID=71717 RepID=A0A4Y7T5D1_COPMI|nr:hypothetical protein FA13DRAFT_757481 [Coprinellus micaceus]
MRVVFSRVYLRQERCCTPCAQAIIALRLWLRSVYAGEVKDVAREERTENPLRFILRQRGVLEAAHRGQEFSVGEGSRKPTCSPHFFQSHWQYDHSMLRGCISNSHYWGYKQGRSSRYSLLYLHDTQGRVPR